MCYRILAVCILLFSPTFSRAYASGDCGTISKSSSGYVQLCTGCQSEYYYLYANQHACIHDGQVVRESHSFSMSGALATTTPPKLHGVLNNWVVWETDSVFLAIPSNGERDFYVKSKRVERDGLSLSGWFLLSN
jgi:hypothetical protein